MNWKSKVYFDSAYYFYIIMYNEHFQYPQFGATSSFPYESISRPSPIRTEAQRSSVDHSNPHASNSLIIKKIEDLFPVLEQMAGQNDMKSNNVVSKLMGLKEALDEACR